MPCLSCQKSSSSPLNFLLNCISCPHAWHHRCHSPPVSDKELIAIIKAFNAEKHNPAAKLIWQCGICIKAKNAVNHQNRQFIAVKKATPRHVLVQKAIVIDEDEEITVLDGPSSVPKRNETTNPQLSHSSHAVVHQGSLTMLNSLSHPKYQSSTAPSSDQLNIPRIQPPQGRTSCIKDKQTRIIDDPFLVPDPSPSHSKPSQTSSSSNPSGFIDLTISSDEEMNSGGGDDVLEYLTPPPTPAPPSKHVVGIMEKVTPTLTSNQGSLHPLPRDASPTMSIMTTALPPPNQLLTRWLNDRSTIAGVKPDLWARACLRRDQDAANRRNLGSEQSVPSISPHSRRKGKAHKLNEGSRPTFFLSAEGWLREKQASLLLE